MGSCEELILKVPVLGWVEWERWQVGMFPSLLALG